MCLEQVRTLTTSEATSFPFCSFMLLRLLGQHGGSQLAVLSSSRERGTPTVLGIHRTPNHEAYLGKEGVMWLLLRA